MSSRHFISDGVSSSERGRGLLGTRPVLRGIFASGGLRPGSRTRWIGWIGTAIVLLLAVVGRWKMEPYDDAYFFKRFALNFLRDGVFAWNVSDGPVHGNTSQLHQLVVTVLTAIDPAHTIALTRVVLALALGLAIVVLSRGLAAKAGPPLYLMMLSPFALATVWTGMETAIVFVLTALFLRSLLRDVESFPWVPSVLAVVLYLARPDTALLTFSALAIARWHRGVRSVVAPILVALAGIGAFLLVFHLYYGTALPMSFYLKSGQSLLYDEHFLALSRISKWKNLLFVACMLAPAVYVLAVARSFGRTVAICLLPAAAFIGYHAVMTVEVMGMHGRFYAPALPFIAFAVASVYPTFLERRSRLWAALFVVVLCVVVIIGYQTQWLPTRRGWPIGRTEPALYGGYLVATLAVLAGGGRRWAVAPTWAWVAIALGVMLALPAHGLGWPHDRSYLKRHQRHVKSYRGLPQLVECLGDQLHVHHSEVGVVGLVFARGKVTDLGGLMSPELTLGDTSFDELCQRDPPDAIFLPHRNYRTLNEIIKGSECLRGYQRVVSDSSSPLYVRRDLMPAYRCRGKDTPSR